MIRKIVAPKKLIFLLVATFVLCGFNYVCYAESGEDAIADKGFWKEVWSKVTSHEEVKINERGNTVPVRKVLKTEQKKADKAKFLKMIKSSLDTYPEIVEKMPNLSVLRTPGRENVYFYKAPDGKIFDVSELDEKTLKNLWKNVNRNLNW